MKKFLKIAGLILGILILLLGSVLLYLRYEFCYKRTEITKSTEGAYTLIVYQVGEARFPFGPVDGEVVLHKEKKQINAYSFCVLNDGGGLASDDIVLDWEEDCVKIRVSGEEQPDMLYILKFDGTNYSEKAGPWFTDEEVIALVKERYGEETVFQNKNNSVYRFRAQVSQPEEGGFEFYVEQDKDALVDNYLNAYFKYISDIYFQKYYMNAEWPGSGYGAATNYIPCFRLSSSYDRDIMNFCEKFCDYLEYCISVEVIAKESQLFQRFPMTISGNNFVFQPTIRMEEYDRTLIYNDLYTRIDEILHMPKVGSVGNKTAGEEIAKEVSQKTKNYYMTLEPACSFQTEGGMEYRMVAVDRALGSSFYVLIGVEDHGKTCAFVNPDPYNGSGGESRWITFIDENLGFSCLAHGAGSYGSLYRTEDGGSSWEIVGYPSARAKFVDGTYYNPFIMPEKVYEENGILYLEVGQGADGDYYDGELGFCHGLYQSSDRGLNWKFVQNMPVNREYLRGNPEVEHTNLESAVETALQNLEVSRLLPDGKAAYVGDGEAFDNSMAIQDVDMDGQKELLLNIGGTCMADMGFYVYQFDESLDDMYKFRQELVVWPSATFYTNGIVIAELSHNHGYSANDEFWPYHIYDYSSETDEYVKLWEVDAWEKRLRETDHQGVKFPDSIDIDGDGMVYRIYVEETGELMLMDSADYKEWVSEQIKDGEEIEILWREIP